MSHLGSPRDKALMEIFNAILIGGEAACERAGTDIQVGDVVIQQFAAATRWWASVVEEIGTGDRYSRTVKLRSIGETETANWSNVSFTIINRGWVRDNPRILWTEAELEFTRRLHKKMGELDFVDFAYARPPDILTPNGTVEFYQDTYHSGPRYRADLLDWRNMDDHRMETMLRHTHNKFEEATRGN